MHKQVIYFHTRLLGHGNRTDTKKFCGSSNYVPVIRQLADDGHVPILIITSGIYFAYLISRNYLNPANSI